MLGIKEVLVQWFTNSLIKKSSVGGIKNENMSDQQLAKELHKPIIRKFQQRKVKSPFTDKIWNTDLADMQLIGKFNDGFRFYYV